MKAQYYLLLMLMMASPGIAQQRSVAGVGVHYASVGIEGRSRLSKVGLSARLQFRITDGIRGGLNVDRALFFGGPSMSDVVNGSKVSWTVLSAGAMGVYRFGG